MAVDIALYVKSIMALQLGMIRLFLPPSKSCRNVDQISLHNLGKPEAFYSVSVNESWGTYSFSLLSQNTN